MEREPSDHCKQGEADDQADRPDADEHQDGQRPEEAEEGVPPLPRPHAPRQGGPGRPRVDVEEPGEPELAGDAAGQEHRLEGVPQDQAIRTRLAAAAR